MPDGTIPLYGLSPSAVSKQWGFFNVIAASDLYKVSYPLAFSNHATPVAIKEDLKEESYRDFIIVDFNTEYFTFAAKDPDGIACTWIAIGF
jgi:hypothetical protein